MKWLAGTGLKAVLGGSWGNLYPNKGRQECEKGYLERHPLLKEDHHPLNRKVG